MHTYYPSFRPNSFAYFFEIVVILFSNIKYETNFYNTDLNGLKKAISNSWIKWVALSENRTNMNLSTTIF